MRQILGGVALDRTYYFGTNYSSDDEAVRGESGEGRGGEWKVWPMAMGTGVPISWDNSQF